MIGKNSHGAEVITDGLIGVGQLFLRKFQKNTSLFGQSLEMLLENAEFISEEIVEGSGGDVCSGADVPDGGLIVALVPEHTHGDFVDLLLFLLGTLGLGDAVV